MIGRGTLALLLSMAVTIPLAACGEKPQTAGPSSAKKSDAQAWTGPQDGAYATAGWKVGDKDSWETQMKTRAQQGQNEYNRSAPAAKPQ